MQLLTIPFSHFCEKARWGLDRAGLEYREVKFAPVAQRIAVVPLRSSTVPALIDGTTVIRESNDILRFADEQLPEPSRLFPQDEDACREVEQLLERFDEGIGPQIRVFFYSWATERPDRLMHFGTNGLPTNQKLLMRGTLPVITQALKMHFGIKPGTHERCEEFVSREFEYVSELLADGRDYLVGDRFSAADLAFSAFVGQFIGAPEYGGNSFDPREMPEELARQEELWTQSRAGQWVRGIYGEHRFEIVGAPDAALAAG